MTRVVEFRSSEQPHMSVSESLYYRLAEPLLFRDLDGVLGDIAAACCRRCGEVTLRADEVANHLCISGERTARLVERGMDAFRAIVDRKDLKAALASAEARAAAAEQRADAAVAALRASWGIIHEGLHGGKPADPEHQYLCEMPSCRRIRAILAAAQQGAEGQPAEGPHEFDGACRNVQHADTTCTCNHPVNGRRCGQSRYAPIHRDAAPTAAPGATDANV